LPGLSSPFAQGDRTVCFFAKIDVLWDNYSRKGRLGEEESGFKNFYCLKGLKNCKSQIGVEGPNRKMNKWDSIYII